MSALPLDDMIACFRCGVSNNQRAWKDNGCMCPFCNRWFSIDLWAELRRLRIAARKTA